MDRGYWPASRGPGRATPSIRAPSRPARWRSPAALALPASVERCSALPRSSSMRLPSSASSASGRWTAPPSVGEPADVVGLVILGCARPRNEDRRRPGDGDLGHCRRPAASDEEIGSRVHEIHPALVTDDLMDHFRRRGDLAGKRLGEAVAGHVMDGESSILIVSFGVGDDRIVERPRTLRPPGDGEDEAVDRQSQRRSRRVAPRRPVDLADRPANRGAGNGGAAQRRSLERNRRRRGEARR